MSDFQGLPIRTLTNGLLSVTVLAEAGPRIVGLAAAGQPNLLADTPAAVDTPYGEYSYRGGHRLWHAPEAFPRTYIPDDHGVIIDDLVDGVRLNGPTEIGTGIAKTIEIHLLPGRPVVAIRHSLRNDGLWPVELAPWAVTMLRLGGTAILPQPVGSAGQNSLLNNRVLALWPYARIDDPRLELRDDFILIRAQAGPSPIKLGYYNPHGWMAYWLNGVLFRKSYDVSPGAAYPDGGCNAESYCDDRFVELESLGPLTRLDTGETVSLNETWELTSSLDAPFLSGAIREALAKI